MAASDKNELVNGILQGNKAMLSRAITLLESTRPDHNALAAEVLDAILPHTGNSLRIGITGVPGVGKSTIIEAMGKLLLENGEKLAVLAIDPSSKKSRGSILGDKTRMETISGKEEVFIRPSPAGETLGGVGRKTRESILLCEAAGFTNIFVETVGVGQSETAVHSMVDCFLLLMLPGAGDELQGIKRGIMEMADIIAINKAEGESAEMAQKAAREYKNALHLFPPTDSGWIPQVLTCSAETGLRIPELWNTIKSFENHQKVSGFFASKRKNQSIYWFHESLQEKLYQHFFEHSDVKEALKQMEIKIENGELHSQAAASEVMKVILSKH
jgi:LAO/AO transport system kinase